jgi:hypothetical protein
MSLVTPPASRDALTGGLRRRGVPVLAGQEQRQPAGAD